MNIEIREENITQAKKALRELEEVVFFSLQDLEYLTEPTTTRNISHSLNFTADSEVQIVKCVLNKLKAEGRVGNMGDSGEAWKIPRR